MIATRPARDAFRHMETSGFPYLTHVNIMHTTVAMAGATVVVSVMDASCATLVAAAPLKPYQPSHNIKTPRQPRGRLCPGNAFTFVIFPSLSATNFPMRGPKIAAPINAEIPPTICMAQEPAKS